MNDISNIEDSTIEMLLHKELMGYLPSVELLCCEIRKIGSTTVNIRAATTAADMIPCMSFDEHGQHSQHFQNMPALDSAVR